jgi:Breast carcinoma amplified sequence 2 (BCAS2)
MPEENFDSVEVVVYNEQEKPLILDSLPYIDALHEDYEEYALALVEAEMQNMVPPEVSRLTPVRWKSSLVQQDYRALIRDPNALELRDWNWDRAVEPTIPTTKNESMDIEREQLDAWRQAVRQARIEYESELRRSIVLEIEQSVASVFQWKQYGTKLEQIQSTMVAKVNMEKSKVDQIHARRQKHQEQVAVHLQRLSSEFNHAVHKRIKLEAAVEFMKQKLEILKTEKADSQQSNTMT